MFSLLFPLNRHKLFHLSVLQTEMTFGVSQSFSKPHVSFFFFFFVRTSSQRARFFSTLHVLLEVIEPMQCMKKKNMSSEWHGAWDGIMTTMALQQLCHDIGQVLKFLKPKSFDERARAISIYAL